MAGTGDEVAAAGGSHMRASHADRERVIYTLKVAFVQGRLTKDEFDLRMARTLASRTYGELAVLTADLPAGLIRTRLPSLQGPAPAELPVNKPLMWGAIVATIGGVASIASFTPAHQFLLLVVGVFIILLAAPVAGTLMLDSWRARRSDRPPPPGHASADQISQIGLGRPDREDGNGCAASEARGSVTARPSRERGIAMRSLWLHAPRAGQVGPAGLQGAV